MLVVLDQGTDLIERNADVLIACIRTAIGLTDAPLVVGGMSMGGLISRYALAAMEARGEDHQTGVFLTIDTPHAGAYTSLGAQWFVQSFAPHLSALDAYAYLLDSPANQQMMLWWLHDGSAQTSPLREAFLRDLAGLGEYPQRPRRLAVSCGRGDGARGAEPGALALRWSGEPWLQAELHALAQRPASAVGEGKWFLAEPPELEPLGTPGGPAWDVAPGGHEPFNAEAAALAAGLGCGSVTDLLGTTCAVPTVSALDLDQDPFAAVPEPGSGAGPFASYAFCAQNQPHLTITPELRAWLLEELRSPVAQPEGSRDD